MTWILPKQLHTLACALDTEALSLDCTEQSRICEQSLFVRSKPSPLRTWLQRWKRDSWTQHLSGRILRPSLGRAFEAAWTSSLADTRANHSVQPDSAKAKTIRGISGRGLQMAFDFSSPGAASLRTSKDISAWGCPTSSKTWQEWVTERRGAYSQRLNAVRRTSASGCSSWPTISVNESKNSVGKSQLDRNSVPLGTMAAMSGPPAQGSSSMDGSRRESWATPRANKTEGYSSPEFRPTLHQQAQNWATTRAGMARGNKFTYDRGKGNIEEQAGASVQGGGKLNPRWVETLMGLPVGWTMPSCASPVTIERMSSDSSATASSQQQQNEPSEH